MRCSSCSEVVKPVVAVDIDGTLGDYHGHLTRFAIDYFGTSRVIPRYDGFERFREWFCIAFSCDLRTFRDVKLAYRQGAMKRSMPVLPGAAGLTAALRDEGAEVWLTTTRPYLRLDGIDPDTRAWLERNDIVYDALMYDESKYKVLAERVDNARVVAILDDQEDQLVSANSHFPIFKPAIMRKTVYNKAVHFDPYVINLEEARLLITGRIRNWKESNDVDRRAA